MEWKRTKKFDAHIHVLPTERLTQYDAQSCLQKATLEHCLGLMDAHNIERAVLVPNNNARMYDDMRRTNEFLAQCVQKAPERLVAFSDLSLSGAEDMYQAADELAYAVRVLGLRGLKIHPSNLNIPMDDLRFVPVLRQAAALKFPVMVHAYP